MIRESFNANWYFHKEDSGRAAPTQGPLTLPHDAMLYETRDPHTKNGHHTGYFPGGVYRYTKTFFAPEEWRRNHIALEFEGVYRSAQVFLNGQLAGERPSGYAHFYVSADPFLRYGYDNTIEVQARNDQEPNSRWYSGSGIYRDVHLLVGGLVHIQPDGVKITTRAVQGQRAVVEVAATLVNHTSGPASVRVGVVFRYTHGTQAAKGELDASGSAAATLQAGETATVRQSVTFTRPALWSPDHPNLYACATQVLAQDAESEVVLDEDVQTLGIRTLALDARQGLRINGEEIKLRGGCLHHDNGVIGAHTLAAAEDRRVRLMKASGFNAIRSAHNPISKAMLDACDRHGLLVMDEFSDVWFEPKTRYDYSRYFRDWWERDIQAMVDKDYNHPCVVLYSIGNEIRETATPEGVEYSRKLAEKVKSLDPTRYVINSINGWYSMIARLGPGKKKKTPVETGQQAQSATSRPDVSAQATAGYINPLMNFINRFMDRIVSLPLVDQGTRDAYATVDVAGYNYMAGRYALDGKRYPQRVICGSETFPPEIAKNWRLVKKLPHVIGDFSWTGWDYLGEAGLCTWQYGRNQALYKPYPCILADSAMIDITGHRQAQSYIHEIVWGLRKEPYIAVQPVNHAGERPSKSVWRGTNAIASWSWEGCEGKKAVVEVYADAASVELFLNGKSLGQQPAGDARDFKAVFQTTYQPGELTAISYAADGREIGRMTLQTARPHLQLQLQAEETTLHADGTDLAFIHIRLTDERGIVRPLADRPVTLRVTGAGSLLGFGSANPLTEESFTDAVHTTFQGRALAVVRAGFEPGTLKVTASAPDCESQSMSIRVEGREP